MNYKIMQCKNKGKRNLFLRPSLFCNILLFLSPIFIRTFSIVTNTTTQQFHHQ